jgi:hypothetical protein
LPHTERLAELAALDALEALDGAELRDFESHCREGCASCESAVRSWRGEVDRLALVPDPIEPPAGLRGRVMASAAG